jgi:hypothetical protein
MKSAFSWVRELKQQCSLPGENPSWAWTSWLSVPIDPVRFEIAVLFPFEMISIHLPNVLCGNKQPQDGDVAEVSLPFVYHLCQLNIDIWTLSRHLNEEPQSKT